jgi:hypothetical protein
MDLLVLLKCLLNFMNGRRYQMLRSGDVPAWLQLLGAAGNRECGWAKAFGRIRLAVPEDSDGGAAKCLVR